MIDDDYNWSPLGRSFWARAALETNSTPLMARFACAKLRRKNHSAAAREAGVGRTAKQQGYSMANKPKVIAMMAMAATANGSRPKRLLDTQPDGEMTGAERKSILEGIGRDDNDPAVKIRAIETLDRMDERAAQRDRQELSLDEAYERADKAAPLYGPQFITDAFFNEHKSLPWSCEAFTKLVTRLASTFPDRWQHYQSALPGHRLKFQEVGLAG